MTDELNHTATRQEDWGLFRLLSAVLTGLAAILGGACFVAGQTLEQGGTTSFSDFAQVSGTVFWMFAAIGAAFFLVGSFIDWRQSREVSEA